MNDKISVRWSRDAVKLLGKRDRGTERVIRADFERAPTEGGILFDAAKHQWVTPVADNRYSVVWALDPDSNTANVQAVLPARFTSTDPVSVKEQVGKVILMETDGAVELP